MEIYYNGIIIYSNFPIKDTQLIKTFAYLEQNSFRIICIIYGNQLTFS